MDEETMVALEEFEVYDAAEDDEVLGYAATFECSEQGGCTS
jgi:hypothetical protein